MTYSKEANQRNAPFVLLPLPYSKDVFTPHFTAETFDYHYGKHHQAYVTNLNNLLEKDHNFASQDLETIILNSAASNNTSIFNNAAQVWNHSFFWHSIKPSGGGKPEGEMLTQIEKDFGSYDEFAKNFKEAAVTQFGSGWAWLVYCEDRLQIVKTANAETPITRKMQPLLACDVWEHAYYIDYRNKRPDYVSIYIDHMINWDFALENMKKVK